MELLALQGFIFLESKKYTFMFEKQAVLQTAT